MRIHPHLQTGFERSARPPFCRPAQDGRNTSCPFRTRGQGGGGLRGATWMGIHVAYLACCRHDPFGTECSSPIRAEVQIDEAVPTGGVYVALRCGDVRSTTRLCKATQDPWWKETFEFTVDGDRCRDTTHHHEHSRAVGRPNPNGGGFPLQGGDIEDLPNADYSAGRMSRNLPMLVHFFRCLMRGNVTSHQTYFNCRLF